MDTLNNEYEYITLILWYGVPNILSTINNIIEKNSSKNIEYVKEFNINKIEFARSIYYPYNVDPSIHEPMRFSKSPNNITLIIIKDTSYNYTYRERIEGILPVNSFSLYMKETLREKYKCNFIHSSDNINEANDVLNYLKKIDNNLNNYILNYKYILTNSLLGIIFTKRLADWNNIKIKSIDETPQYNYFENNLEYIDYLNIDKSHKIDKYLELIKNYEPNLNITTADVCCNEDNMYNVIFDGLHRTAISLYKKATYIKVRIININIYNNCLKQGNISHHTQFREIINKLNNDKIVYYCLFGYENLPYSIDGDDFDICITPYNYSYVISLLNKYYKFTKTNNVLISNFSHFQHTFNTINTINKENEHTIILDIFNSIYIVKNNKYFFIQTIATCWNNEDVINFKYIKIPKYEITVFLVYLRIKIENKDINSLKYQNRLKLCTKNIDYNTLVKYKQKYFNNIMKNNNLNVFYENLLQNKFDNNLQYINPTM